MCGLVGMAGKLHGKNDQVFKNLLVMDSLRGEDSTGAAFVQRYEEDKVTVVKEVGDPFVLLYNNRFNTQINKSNRVLIGHNRFATVGGVSRATAHPFNFDTLVGAHNGTLQSKYRLKNNLDYKVDSENLYHHIEENGLQDAINQLHGNGNAWALTWWDKDKQTINFLRNKERPLWLAYAKDAQVIYWASEVAMLVAALARHGIETLPPFLLTEDVHMSIKVAKDGELSKPTIKRCAAPVPVVEVVRFPPNNSVPRRQDTKPPAITNQHLRTVQSSSKGEDNTKKLPVMGEANKNSSVSDASFLNIKQGKFEILSHNTDVHGQKYLSLYCTMEERYQYYEIRLYYRRDDQHFTQMIGEELLGDVSSFHDYDSLGGRGYYKVSPWTVKLNLVPESSFMTSRGDLVPESEWKKIHKECVYCSDPLSPLNRNVFTTEHQCLCPSCAKDEEVLQYVKIK